MIETMTAMEMKQALLFDVDSDAEIMGIANECYMLENIGLVAYEAENKMALGKSIKGAAASLVEFIKRIAAKLVQWASAAARMIRIHIMNFQKARAEKRLKDAKEAKIPAYFKEILDKSSKLTSDLTGIDIEMAIAAETDSRTSSIIKTWEDIGKKYATAETDTDKKESVTPSTVIAALGAAMNAVTEINKDAARLNKFAAKVDKFTNKYGIVGSSLSMKRASIQKGTSIKMSMARKIFTAAIAASKAIVSENKKAAKAAENNAKTTESYTLESMMGSLL